MIMSKLTLKSLQETVEIQQLAIDELTTQVIALSALVASQPAKKARNYGPSSSNAMTDELAWRIRYGDLVGTAVRKIADDEGLSRGQVYSCTGGYTFNHVNDEFNEILMYINDLERTTTEA